MSDLYTSVAAAKAFLRIPEDDTTEDARLTTFITVVSRAIDMHCRRHFYLSTETRRYDAQRLIDIPKARARPYPWGHAMRRLWLDADLHHILELLNGDGSIVDSADYVLYPLDGPPYRWIEMRLDRGALFRWQQTPQAAFHVSGQWGFVTPESEGVIPVACQMWVGQMRARAENPGVQSTSIGSFSVSFQQPATVPGAAGGVEMLPPMEVAQMLSGFRFREIVAMG